MHHQRQADVHPDFRIAVADVLLEGPFQDGFPNTPEALLEAGKALNAENKKALTYWGNTAFDGEAASRYFYQVISSFGGEYDDGQGNLKLNTPENIKAIEFMREVVKQGLSSESVPPATSKRKKPSSRATPAHSPPASSSSRRAT